MGFLKSPGWPPCYVVEASGCCRSLYTRPFYHSDTRTRTRNNNQHQSNTDSERTREESDCNFQSVSKTRTVAVVPCTTTANLSAAVGCVSQRARQNGETRGHHGISSVRPCWKPAGMASVSSLRGRFLRVCASGPGSVARRLFQIPSCSLHGPLHWVPAAHVHASHTSGDGRSAFPGTPSVVAVHSATVSRRKGIGTTGVRQGECRHEGETSQGYAGLFRGTHLSSRWSRAGRCEK